MAKESPFTKSIMETLEKLRGHGIIDHVWKNYLPVIDEEKCKEPKVKVYSYFSILDPRFYQRIDL